VTASFRILYVFVAMEVGSRRILHANASTFSSRSTKAILSEFFASTFAITIADVRILPWDRDFQSRPKPRFRLVHIGTSFPMVIVLYQHRFSAACITSTA
jgi:hypothetical protein